MKKFNALSILLKYLFILLLVSITLSGCVGSRKKATGKGTPLAGSDTRRKTSDGHYYTLSKIDGSKNLYIETTRFSGIIFSESVSSYYDKDLKRFTPTVEEVFKAEQIFRKFLRIGENKDGKNMNSKRIHAPSRYYRQYFGFYNQKGERIIYFNCLIKDGFVKSNPSWKTEEFIVLDGGNSYFSTQVNITIQDCSPVAIHGTA